MKPGIKPAFADQPLMAATFDDTAAIENMNHISMLNGRKPVCDDDGRPALHQNFKRILNLPLGFGIKRACGFIQQQDRRISENGPGNCQSLTLAAGELLSLARRSRFQSRPVERK